MAETTRGTVTVHYDRAGAGPPLMLIPGMLSDAASWTPVIGPLAEAFDLLLPDPRGAGRTRPRDAPISLEALARDMLAVADHAGVTRFAVAGHSLGGLVALTVAGLAPERVSRVLALAATPRPSARIPYLFEMLATLRCSAGDRAYYGGLFTWLFSDGFFRDGAAVRAAIDASLAYPHAQTADAMRHQVTALGRLDRESLPSGLSMPALAILAGADAMIPVEEAEAHWRAFGAAVTRIAGAGHALHWDAPEAVSAAMAAFLAGGD